MKRGAARRARQGEAETKGDEKVTVGEKWRNEIKDREKLKSGSRTGAASFQIRGKYWERGENWKLKWEEISG